MPGRFANSFLKLWKWVVGLFQAQFFFKEKATYVFFFLKIQGMSGRLCPSLRARAPGKGRAAPQQDKKAGVSLSLGGDTVGSVPGDPVREHSCGPRPRPLPLRPLGPRGSWAWGGGGVGAERGAHRPPTTVWAELHCGDGGAATSAPRASVLSTESNCSQTRPLGLVASTELRVQKAA